MLVFNLLERECQCKLDWKVKFDKFQTNLSKVKLCDQLCFVSVIVDQLGYESLLLWTVSLM